VSARVSPVYPSFHPPSPSPLTFLVLSAVTALVASRHFFLAPAGKGKPYTGVNTGDPLRRVHRHRHRHRHTHSTSHPTPPTHTHTRGQSGWRAIRLEASPFTPVISTSMDLLTCLPKHRGAACLRRCCQHTL
jgi:predicted GIY-YIG superfamily endonuclease